MADNMTPAESHPGTASSFAAPPKARSSRAGKVAIGAVLLLLILAVAAGAFFVFFGGSSDSTDIPSAPAPAGVEQAVAQTTPAPAPSSSEVTITPVEPLETPLTDVFTFRDIFEPLAKAPATSSGGTTGGTPTGGGSTTNSANTILLQDITSENGEPKAVVVWNGTTYTVGEGEQVDGSAWEVLSIGTDSVVMLYGDVQVTLSIGQAITK